MDHTSFRLGVSGHSGTPFYAGSHNTEYGVVGQGYEGELYANGMRLKGTLGLVFSG